MIDLSFFFQSNGGNFILKIAFLLLEALFIAFSVIVVNQVSSLNKLFFIQPAHSSRVIQILGFLQLIFAIFLFIITLAIL